MWRACSKGSTITDRVHPIIHIHPHPSNLCVLLVKYCVSVFQIDVRRKAAIRTDLDLELATFIIWNVHRNSCFEFVLQFSQFSYGAPFITIKWKCFVCELRMIIIYFGWKLQVHIPKLCASFQIWDNLTKCSGMHFSSPVE